MADTLAALPPSAWAKEIDEAARLFSDDTEDQDHYAHLLYIETIKCAIHWDPYGTPTPTNTATTSAPTVTSELDRLMTELTGPASDRARQARAQAFKTINESIDELARRNATQTPENSVREQTRGEVERWETPRTDTYRHPGLSQS